MEWNNEDDVNCANTNLNEDIVIQQIGLRIM